MKNKIIWTLLVMGLVGCATGSRVSDSFKPRDYTQETLSNGLKILWIPDSTLPRVSMQLMVFAGGIDEEAGREGLAALTAQTLDQGTGKRKALELAEAIEQIGSEFSATPGLDFTNFAMSGLSTRSIEMLDLFSEIILSPSFQDADIERRRSLMIAALKRALDQPNAFADEQIEREVFKGHRYSTPLMGTVDSLKTFTRADLLRHYFAYYRPNNSVLAVVGRFDQSFQELVRTKFKNWSQSEVKRVSRRSLEFQPGNTVQIVKKGLQQTQIRWAHLGIKRSDPDFLPLRLANMVLGGSFASRLNQRIRDDLGLTYSINSQSNARLDRGEFEISTFTRHEKVNETIKETRALFADFVEKGISDAELDAAKAVLVGQFPSALETPDKLAFNLMVLRRYGIGDDYLAGFQKTVGKITRQQVNEAIKRHLHPDKLITVIYSDRKFEN